MKIKEIPKANTKSDKRYIYNDKKDTAIEVSASVAKVMSAIFNLDSVADSMLIRDTIANVLKINDLSPAKGFDKILRKNLITLFDADCIRKNLQVNLKDLDYFIDFFTSCPSGYDISQLILPHVELKPVYT